MPEYRYGALYVVEDRSGKPEIDAALKQLDSRLFVEKQVSLEGEYVWCVVTEIGGDYPPLTILEWRDESGGPIHELSSGIVERVRRLERDPIVLARKLREQNEERKRALDKRRDEAYEEIARDMIPRIHDRVRPVFHTSTALRMTRDKMRRQGKRK